jgi:hypothetical protein
MGCGRKKARYKNRKEAERHGAISYGKTSFTVRKRKGGWSAYEK